VKRLTKWPALCMSVCSLFQILNESLCTKFSQHLYLHRSFQILELILLVLMRVTSPPNSPSCVHLKEIRCSDLRHLNATMKRKSSSHAKHLLHRPFLLYPNAEEGQYIQLTSFRQSVCNHYITLIVSY